MYSARCKYIDKLDLFKNLTRPLAAVLFEPLRDHHTRPHPGNRIERKETGPAWA